MVEAFLRASVTRSANLRLIVDAHASIAFLAGAVLDLKSGVQTHLVQKGRVGARTWRADDGTAAKGARLDIVAESMGAKHEIAIAISISQLARSAGPSLRPDATAERGDTDFLRYADRTRSTKCRRRRACRRTRGTDLQSFADGESRRPGRGGPYFRGVPEQRPIFPSANITKVSRPALFTNSILTAGRTRPTNLRSSSTEQLCGPRPRPRRAIQRCILESSMGSRTAKRIIYAIGDQPFYASCWSVERHAASPIRVWPCDEMGGMPSPWPAPRSPAHPLLRGDPATPP